MTDYPSWCYYPSHRPAPAWAHAFLEVVRGSQAQLDTRQVADLTSDKVLAVLRPGLVALGYQVEDGKQQSQKIRRPVLFGGQGSERVAYEIDAVHDELEVLVEVEAGRGARGNAVYRDLVRSSLIVDAQYLVIGVMLEYRVNSAKKQIVVRSYEDATNQLDAIFASGRLQLPFDGVLAFGY